MTGCGPGGSTSNIRIIGCDDGEVHPIHGEDAGTTGATLKLGGLEDLYEAPIRTVERTPVRMDGAILRSVKTAVMEPVITVIVKGDQVNEFGQVDGALREAFSFELDPYYPDSTLARIEWETGDSTRWLEVVLAEGSSYETEKVPHSDGEWEWEIHLKAYVPFWQEDDEVTSVEFTQAESGTTKPITVSNPTGVDMAHKWSGTVATWKLPDNSWEGRSWDRKPGGLWPTRTVPYPDLTADNGGLIVDMDPMQLPVRDAYDTNLIGAMPVQGDFPKYLIPRFTQEQTLDVTATNVPAAGAAMTLRQPRRFRKPWGRV
ncbi:hypothetical protein L5G28_07815 [Gordonia sp. HY285]|uniref:hypothetical protein n=1 Tax=Gordonia liuliyuniae TaxID=2911517 RepID=UPI001F459D84|nr:hypothetical protein [Gordonia liuliyuniae]MCF8610068.1 hypothetical protein [Gordonia liuliyuniae]